MNPNYTLDEIRPDLTKVLKDKTPITGALSVVEAYLLMQACQLTVTHPGMSEIMKEFYWAIGHRMQELIRPHVSELFAGFCEAGWHREYDK